MDNGLHPILVHYPRGKIMTNHARERKKGYVRLTSSQRVKGYVKTNLETEGQRL